MKSYPKSEQLRKKKRINLLFKERSRSRIIKDLDKIISDRVRARADWRCERCMRQFTPPTMALHCSHYFSRRFMGTRWDMDNLCALCFGCHRLVESDKQEGSWYHRFMTTQLGEEGLERLRIKAYGICKYSKQDLELLLKVIQSQ